MTIDKKLTNERWELFWDTVYNHVVVGLRFDMPKQTNIDWLIVFPKVGLYSRPSNNYHSKTIRQEKNDKTALIYYSACKLTVVYSCKVETEKKLD